MLDSEIVDLFFRLDETAIHYCSRQYGARLRTIAYGILRDTCDSEECENETYWEAWKSIPPHCPVNYLFAYLARIVRSRARNKCRKHSVILTPI